MSLPPAHRSDGGFTLVEVLLATALLAVVAAMVFGSLHLSTLAIDGARATAARDQMLRSTLRVITEELTASVANPIGPWMGLNAQQEGQPADTLAFLTLGQFRGFESGQETEFVRIVYAREGDRLFRFVRRNLYGLTDDSVDRLELASNVKGFNVRYFDAQANLWTDDWDGRARTSPPGAVLIELTLMLENAEPRTFRQWVPVGVRS